MLGSARSSMPAARGSGRGAALVTTRQFPHTQGDAGLGGHLLRRLAPHLFLALALIAAAARLYRPAFGASDLYVTPDSGEYAVGAHRLATLGRYDLEIERIAYPPRYPPWFSLCLSPAYSSPRASSEQASSSCCCLPGRCGGRRGDRSKTGRGLGRERGSRPPVTNAQYAWLSREIRPMCRPRRSRCGPGGSSSRYGSGRGRSARGPRRELCAAAQASASRTWRCSALAWLVLRSRGVARQARCPLGPGCCGRARDGALQHYAFGDWRRNFKVLVPGAVRLPGADFLARYIGATSGRSGMSISP